MALISVKDVSIGYGTNSILDGISFEVNEGDYLSILGENGSGKTTLLKTMIGLSRPMKGTVSFGDGLRKDGIGYLPQQTLIQRDFPASVREIVLSGFQGRLKKRLFYSREERSSVEEIMQKLGIAEISRKSFRDLSGGQQQRVLLARALTATGKLLIMDEPVSGLDPRVTEEFYELVEDLHREGITIIMISHDVKNAVRYSTHVLDIGRSVFFGTTDEFLREEGREEQ